jgi:hypothetical protein
LRLRAISSRALTEYPGVEGGFYPNDKTDRESLAVQLRRFPVATGLALNLGRTLGVAEPTRLTPGRWKREHEIGAIR